MAWYGTKDKRKAFIIRMIADLPTVIEKRKIKPTQTKITITRGKESKTYPFLVGKPSFRIGRTFIYLVDVEGGQLHYNLNDSKVSPVLIDAILRQGLAKQLVAGLMTPSLMQYILYLIMGALMGLGFGYILGNALPL